MSNTRYKTLWVNFIILRAIVLCFILLTFPYFCFVFFVNMQHGRTVGSGMVNIGTNEVFCWNACGSFSGACESCLLSFNCLYPKPGVILNSSCSHTLIPSVTPISSILQIDSHISLAILVQTTTIISVNCILIAS